MRTEERPTLPKPSRRALIFAGAAAPLASIPAPARADDGRTEWIAALEACRVADLAYDTAFDLQGAIEDRVSAADLPPVPYELLHRWRNAATGEEGVDELRTQWAIDGRYPAGLEWCADRRARALVALQTWRAAREGVLEAAGYPAAEAAASKTGHAACEAYRQLLKTQAPDNAAVLEKLERMIERDDFEDGVRAMAENLRMHGRA